MGQVVYAAATSHVGAIVKNPDARPERSAKLHDAWRRMDAEIGQAKLDTLIVVATDHYETFGLDHYPTFCLGVGDTHDGWGEFGNPRPQVRGAPEAGAVLLAALLDHNFDLARSHAMRLDHSFTVPLTKLPNAAATPVLPLFVNCNTAPLPTLRRCYQLGGRIAAAAASLPAGHRLGVIGTGGISHWVGLPRFGDINADFDHRFLELLASGRAAEVLGWSDQEILDEAGNGALEIRTWLVAAGAAGGGGEVWAYEPMHPWATGIGIMRFDLPGAAA